MHVNMQGRRSGEMGSLRSKAAEARRPHVKRSPPVERWLPSRSLEKMGASETAPATHVGSSIEMVSEQTVGPGTGRTR